MEQKVIKLSELGLSDLKALSDIQKAKMEPVIANIEISHRTNNGKVENKTLDEWDHIYIELRRKINKIDEAIAGITESIYFNA